MSFPYPGSLCLHATERRQQEFEFDSVFSGDSSQVGVQFMLLGCRGWRHWVELLAGQVRWKGRDTLASSRRRNTARLWL